MRQIPLQFERKRAQARKEGLIGFFTSEGALEAAKLFRRPEKKTHMVSSFKRALFQKARYSERDVT